MISRRNRGRLVGLGAALAVAAGVFSVAAARSHVGGCALPAPLPSLSAPLRALGDFDQPYAAGEKQALRDAAVRVAGALHNPLSTTVANGPVEIAAAGPARYDALVVSLLAPSSSGDGASSTVQGLVSFLRDCSGRQVYFSEVVDLGATSAAGALPGAFPSPDAADAARRLGVSNPRLVYTDSPFHPRWQAPGSERSIPAFP